MSAIDELRSFIREKGYNFEPLVNGSIQRFDHAKPLSGWFVGHDHFDGGAHAIGFAFGCWASDEEIKGSVGRDHLSSDQRKTFDTSVKKIKEQANADKRDRWNELAPEYERIFQGLSEAGDHPYLALKGLAGSFGARAGSDGLLYVPQRDAFGKFWSYQTIAPDGEKRFAAGGRITGTFHQVSPHGERALKDASAVYVCEGFATAASVSMALGDSAVVVCGFNAGNLVSVVQGLREVNKNCRIIICADNDHATFVNGRPKNVGILKAEEAAKKVNGLFVAPVFKEMAVHNTDFNDLHLREGLDIVRAQILIWESAPPKDQWGKFYSELFGGLKKEFVTEKLFLNYNGTWRPALNYEHLIKAHAGEAHLPKAQALEQLAKYQHSIKGKGEFLIPIPEWDGVDHIAHMLSFMKAKNFKADELVELFKDFIYKMIARMHDSQVQNRCLILKGAQGAGKDTFIKAMLGHMGRYMGGFTNSQFNEKDMWIMVSSKGLVHIEEFEQTNKMSVAFLKNLISSSSADFRPPHGRDFDTFRCIASFISTSNIDDILRDTTGNRRFSIIEVEGIDWAYPKDLSEQIIAQAFAMFREGWAPALDLGKLVVEKLVEFEPVNIDSEIMAAWNGRMANLNAIGIHGGNILPGNATAGDVGAIVQDLGRQYGMTIRQVYNLIKRSGASSNRGGKVFYGSTGFFAQKTITH